jgi:hypothetical protein
VAETAREATTLVLPAAMLHVNIILPPFGKGGNYRLLIAHDREGKTALVCAVATAAKAPPPSLDSRSI